jgi:hypothetical protein
MMMNLQTLHTISPADLDTFVCQGPHAVDELPKLLTALGIDEKALSRTQPLVLCDMVRVCASCQQKHQCDRDLDAGTFAQHYQEHCLNASTIDALDLESELITSSRSEFPKFGDSPGTRAHERDGVDPPPVEGCCGELTRAV